jgi:ferrous-iron efflux pump FieF
MTDHTHAPPKLHRLMQIATYAAMASASVLVVTKGFAYLDTKSVAMLSSLADSALDLLASGITFVAVRVALSPPDAGHRFGHGKAEPLSGLAQAAFVGGSAVLVMVEAVSHLHNPTPVENSVTGIIVTAIALLATIALVTFQRYVIRKTDSTAISADSLHYTGDLLLNASVMLSLYLSANMGATWIDPVFGIGISAFMIFNALRIALKAISGLMDHELPEAQRREIIAIAQQHPKVKRVHELRTRSSGLQKFVQMHIVLDGGLTLMDAHYITDDVEKAVQAVFPEADVIIHQDPDGIEEYHQPVGAALS